MRETGIKAFQNRLSEQAELAHDFAVTGQRRRMGANYRKGKKGRLVDSTGSNRRPLNAIQALSRLSYSPTGALKFMRRRACATSPGTRRAIQRARFRLRGEAAPARCHRYGSGRSAARLSRRRVVASGALGSSSPLVWRAATFSQYSAPALPCVRERAFSPAPGRSSPAGPGCLRRFRGPRQAMRARECAPRPAGGRSCCAPRGCSPGRCPAPA